ncbi:MAG: hypothetical protein ACXV3U_08040 [Halobacteriota archaeon]
MMVLGVIAIDLLNLGLSGLELLAGGFYLVVGAIGVITALFTPV